MLGQMHDAGAAARHRVDLGRAWCAWRAPAASARRAARGAASHSIGRAPVAARQSSTSAVCSATWMWIGPSNPSASRHRWAIDAGARGAQRVDRQPGVDERPAARSDRAGSGPDIARASVAKRRWSSRSAGVRSRRARTAPAAASGRCRRRRPRRPAPTTAPAGRRRAGRRGRAAGSGTRRPACSRRAAARAYSCAAMARSCSGVMRSATRYMRSRQDQKSSASHSRRSARPAKARWKAWLCASTRPGSSGPGERRAASGGGCATRA